MALVVTDGMAASRRLGLLLLTLSGLTWAQDTTAGLPATFDPGSTTCWSPASTRDGDRVTEELEEWRIGPAEVVVALQQHKGWCQEGELCSSTAANTSAEPLEILLQAGDSLRLEAWGWSDQWPEPPSPSPDTNVTSLLNGSTDVTTSPQPPPLSEVTLRVSAVNEASVHPGLCPGPPGDLLAELVLQQQQQGQSPAAPENASLSIAPHLLPSGKNRLLVVFRTGGCATWWSLSVLVRLQECGVADGFGLCSEHGRCLRGHANEEKVSVGVVFTCKCCAGFMGRFCEEKDACLDKPCTNGGFCVDIAEGLHGTTFQCLCPHGFRGARCEERVSACDHRPCQNGGSCLQSPITAKGSNSTASATSSIPSAMGYECRCVKGFAGQDCETNVNDCQPNPCVHGVCEDAVAKYKCYCLPGYGGDHCEFEYDECDSSPCINGGQCEDLVAGYRCHCGPGYRGWRCQIKVDLCQPNPCPPPAQCVDRGNNYSCICHPGYNGPGCTKHYDPCYPNSCQNGGSCWPSLDSFFCSCKPGFTGDMCEELVYQPRPLAHTLEDSSVHGALSDAASGSSDTSGGASEGEGEQPGHLHHLYIAAATLAGACAIVLLVVAICHCKVNKTYLQVTRHLGCSDFQPHKIEDQDKYALNLAGSVSERRMFADGVYEATCVDIADCSSLSAPLIR